MVFAFVCSPSFRCFHWQFLHGDIWVLHNSRVNAADMFPDCSPKANGGDFLDCRAFYQPNWPSPHLMFVLCSSHTLSVTTPPALRVTGCWSLSQQVWGWRQHRFFMVPNGDNKQPSSRGFTHVDNLKLAVSLTCKFLGRWDGAGVAGERSCTGTGRRLHKRTQKGCSWPSQCEATVQTTAPRRYWQLKNWTFSHNNNCLFWSLS